MDTPSAFWLKREPLVLASRSSARRALCLAAGLPIEIIAADVDERAIQSELEAKGATAAAIAQLLARAKARATASHVPGRLVVGADQTLALGRDILTKAPDRDAAALQLKKLSGRVHELHAAVSVVSDGDVVFEVVETARLKMRPLSAAFIGLYLKSAGDEVLGCVGAYQLEGLGIHLFESIAGDHTTILGMPMLPLIEFLRTHGSVAK